MNDLIYQIKNLPPERFLKPAGKSGYVCTICGNGSGKSGTGIEPKMTAEGYKAYCHNEGKFLDNIDLLAGRYNLDRTNKGQFAEILKRAAADFGLTGGNFQMTKTENTVHEPTKTANNDLQKLISADVQKSYDRAGQIPQEEKRGLTDETLKYFQIGVDFDWTPPQNRLAGEKSYPSPRVVIPHLPNPALPEILLTYCAALLQTERAKLDSQGKSYTKYLYGGNRTPFGLNTLKDARKAPSFALESLLIVTEGEFDAMSIWQATGGKFACLATGGTADNGTVDALTKFYSGNKPTICFVADNDKAGVNFADKICANLRQNNFPAAYVTFSSIDSAKLDANKILVEQGNAALAERIQELIADLPAKLAEIEKTEREELFGEDAAKYFMEQFQSFVNDNQKFADRKTGFSNIDAQICNFKPGIYVLGGLPALGKTTFALQFLAQLSESGEYCFFCSYEMQKGFLYSKLLAREVAKIETLNFLTVNIIDNPLTAVQISQNKIYEHGDAYRAAIAKITKNKFPLYIWELDEPNIDKLLDRLEKICAKLDKPPIVCIDYLQILAVGSENIKSSIDEVLHKILAFRRKTNTTFIIVSSLNRANYNTEISFESFKESGGIEYSADVILGMQLYLKPPRTPADADKAKKSNPRPIHIKFLKNRFGANFDCYFKYYPAIDYFEPCDESDFEEVEGPPEPCNSNDKNKLDIV